MKMEIYQETVALVQSREDSDLDQAGSSGGGEKVSGYGRSLKVKPVGFAEIHIDFTVLL